MSDEHEEIEQAVTEAFRALELQQWGIEGARALGDALVWMGYAVWRESPAGERGLQGDREKFIADAAAAGYYGETERDKFLAKRVREYLEYLEQLGEGNA